jgi:ATP-dependent Lon protease
MKRELDLENEEERPKKKYKLEFKEFDKKQKEVKREIMNREITIYDILDLDLPMDENVWFFENLDILKNVENSTDEKLRIKNMIYQRYIQDKSIDKKKVEELESKTGLSEDIVSRILHSEHPDDAKAIMYKKYKRAYDNMGNSSSDELYKVIDWIDHVLDLPTKVSASKNGSIDNKLKKLWKSLNENITGLIQMKETIMETMCAKLLDPENKGKVITLVGPPGVGKTAIATSIAEALDMPFDQISFGSVKDSSVLIGHSSTYIGAIPGLFVKILMKSKRLDMVLLLDEIDKIPDTPEGHSISSVLLHVLDRIQNHRFHDMYLPEINVDLSKMIFILSANNLDNVDPVLKDRMSIIKIDGYTIDEKAEIMENHLFPRIRKELGFGDKELIFTRDMIKYLINKKTKKQPGMRDAERIVYQMCERLSLLKYSKNINFSYKIKNIKFPLTIDENLIDKLL